MSIKKVVIQALVAVTLFIIIALIIEGDFSQKMILEKTRNGVVFGLLYAVYIVVRDKFIKR
ncbi:hypothetical protein [Maribacter halichondriae]|uniref:hypothetical protein n=1 Tax=Maribacter halichondriae TaxID=2980554 RepID=UPI0023592F60|nr:hypothetical protein [Maribacter sp. Hal144]